MATFRSGFKIFGELTLRQSLGRIRSYSEDRKPGSWLPEDQWAVRPPCTTCPDPNAPKKPKATKSWLSICRDPEPPLPCDIRHNNCPPPKTDDEPWYAFITKKKTEKPKPPLEACRAELQRQAEMPDEEDTCENGDEIRWPESSESSPCADQCVCKERQPAPVVRLSCPPPKELDLMLWCGRPCLSVTRIASQCLTDRMPYEEFRPKKCWKPPPYSLPCKSEAPIHQPFCCNVGRAPLSEFKQVEIPKPVYTRYKSVELEDENFLLCMTDARCPADNSAPSLAIEPPPTKKTEPLPEEPKREPCLERQVLEAASRKPVKLRFAQKLTFRPKPTKLIERRCFRNPCAQHSAFNLMSIKPPEEDKPQESNCPPPCSGEPPKTITSNISDEPPTYERNMLSRKPPLWMFAVSKPGSKGTPLVPHLSQVPQEPDWCGETDGLKFYDDGNDGICPKPPPDPYPESLIEHSDEPPPCQQESEPQFAAPLCSDEKFVLMPDKYNIRNMRPPEDRVAEENSSFQHYIDAKTANVKTCSKLYPQPKESILYDFARNCPLPPMDPSKPDPPPRKPPETECPQPTRFYYRRYSTFIPFRKPYSPKCQNRMDSGDSREKCKPRNLVPKPKPCGPPVKGPSCNETTLPPCPKAKIPPDCSGKKQIPPCKKKLAPKPSYSECSKSPPPPPRITECNAWEKRDAENARKGPSKGRKFSTWASNEAYNRDSQNATAESMGVLSNLNPTALGPSYSEHLDVKDRGQSIPKPKRASPTQRRVFSGKELMMNFVNPTEDSASYYTSESLVKRRKQQPRRKLKPVQTAECSMGNQLHERKIITLLLQDHHTRNESRVKNLRVTHRDSVLGVYVHNIFSMDLFGSISNWITGLFKEQRKSSQSTSAIRNDQAEGKAYVETVDVERIMKLTKPFRDRLAGKDQIISCYTMDPFDGGHLRNKVPLPLKRLWGKQWNKSLILFPKLNREKARSSMWKFESLSPTIEEIPEKEEPEIKLLTPPKELQKLLRLPVRKPKEKVMSVMENLSKRTVLGNRILRENRNVRTSPLTEKNSFRCYAVSTQRGAATLPGQIQTNTNIKKEPSKKEHEIRPETLTDRFTKSGMGIRTVNELEKVAKKRSSYINVPMKLHVDCNTKNGLNNVITSPNLVKDTEKLNGNILAESGIGKHLKKEKDILAKLDNGAISEVTLKTRMNMLSILEGDSWVRMRGDKVGQPWQLLKFQKISRDIAEPMSSLQRSASLDSITSPLCNNLELDNAGFGIIHYVDNQKQDKTKTRTIEPVRTISYERSSFTPLSLDKKQKAAFESKIGPSEAYQAVTRTRNFAKFSKRPTDGLLDKNPNQKCKDSCSDKQKNDKEGRGSNSRTNNKNDDDDDDERSCRKTTQKKKPGPNCPDA